MPKTVLHFHIQLGTPHIIGEVADGLLKIIPILGGQVNGIIEGKICPYGGDYNVKHDAYTSHVDATYILETKEHEKILVRNRGVVDKRIPGLSKTKPEFMTDQHSSYAYLMNQEFCGYIVRGSHTEIEIEIQEVVHD